MLKVRFSSSRYLGLIAVLAAGALTATADASTPATPQQIAEIAPILGLPAACVAASISSADPAWAVARDTNSTDCPTADGVVILQRQPGGWREVTAGSDFGYCPIDGVPTGVSSEFDLCRRVRRADYVLGDAAFAPNGDGFGESKPRRIFNGGSPSGLVTRIRWRHWGSKHATGRGKNAIYKPSGGYYARRVTIQLRATHRGTCPGSNTPAYLRLEARVPSRPGGKVGKWFRWAGARTVCGES